MIVFSPLFEKNLMNMNESLTMNWNYLIEDAPFLLANYFS